MALVQSPNARFWARYGHMQRLRLCLRLRRRRVAVCVCVCVCVGGAVAGARILCRAPSKEAAPLPPPLTTAPPERCTEWRPARRRPAAKLPAEARLRLGLSGTCLAAGAAAAAGDRRLSVDQPGLRALRPAGRGSICMPLRHAPHGPGPQHPSAPAVRAALEAPMAHHTAAEPRVDGGPACRPYRDEGLRSLPRRLTS